MDILEKHHHYILLFDFYSPILTNKQRSYFSDYYFKDASLAEIAEDNKISRAAVSDQLHRVYKILDGLEDKLKLYEKYVQRNNLYEEYSQTNELETMKLIEKLKEIE